MNVKSYITSLYQTLYSNNIMVRVNEDSWVMYYAFLCDNAGGLIFIS